MEHEELVLGLGELAVRFSEGWHEGIKIDALDIMLLNEAAEALAQPAQEPVAWGVFEGDLHDMFFTEAEAVEMAQLKGTHAEVKPLYTKEKNNAA